MTNINTYKEKLEEEKNLLENQLKDIGSYDSKTGDWDAVPEEQTAPEADESDMADRTEEYQERTGTLNALEMRLNDIKKALEKIENGGFGICEKCGAKIEDDRMLANPAARTCKNCM